MQVFQTVEEIQNFVNKCKNDGKTVGFVPTLGALHDGHMSLIHQSITKCDVTICSIFVNPTQFDDKTDLEKYPRTVEEDRQKLIENGCDVLFLPTVSDVYPDGSELTEEYDIGYLENILEGATRPGHYQGVAQVVHRLLDIVMPDILFLGQKDFQQVLVLKRMIKKQELPTRVKMCDIVREDDGLAMSSRNRRLSKEERDVANELYKTLKSCVENADDIPLKKLQQWAVANLNANELIKVDYISFRNATNLKEIESWDDAKRIVVLGAIFLGPIRLIDNMIVR